jgi:hypothetical protein
MYVGWTYISPPRSRGRKFTPAKIYFRCHIGAASIFKELSFPDFFSGKFLICHCWVHFPVQGLTTGVP